MNRYTGWFNETALRKADIAVRGNHLTAIKNHMPCEITPEMLTRPSLSILSHYRYSLEKNCNTIIMMTMVDKYLASELFEFNALTQISIA